LDESVTALCEVGGPRFVRICSSQSDR